jgi:hypothetical protein
MGFYIKDSVNVGPLRFNLSKSGIGVSAGIKGLRVGTGPRGNYIHMGRGGLYYRKTLPSISNQKKQSFQENITPSSSIEIPSNTHAPLEEIESTTVLSMTDSDSVELLNELNGKRKKHTLWPIALGLGLLFTGLASWSIIGFVITVSLTIIAYYHDLMKKTVVLFYEFESDIKSLYEDLHCAIEEIASSNKIWHIEAQGAVYDKKYHAGADSLLRRKATFIVKKNPSFVKTNITVPAIGVGKQTLFFFPDRLLVFENNSVGAVSYKDLQITTYVSNFIEAEGVPKDSKIIGKTWKYVNKNGGPDKRFSHNPEIPIVEYSYIELKSKTGLNECICLSRTDKSHTFEKAIQKLK